MSKPSAYLIAIAAAVMLWQSLAADPGGVPTPSELLRSGWPGGQVSIPFPAPPAPPVILPTADPLPGFAGLVADARDRQCLAVTFVGLAEMLASDSKSYTWCAQAAGGELLDDLSLPSGGTLGQKYQPLLSAIGKEFAARVGDPKKDTLDTDRRAKAVAFWRSVAASLK